MDAAFMDKIMTKIIPLSWRFALNKRMYKTEYQKSCKILVSKDIHSSGRKKFICCIKFINIKPDSWQWL